MFWGCRVSGLRAFELWCRIRLAFQSQFLNPGTETMNSTKPCNGTLILETLACSSNCTEGGLINVRAAGGHGGIAYPDDFCDVAFHYTKPFLLLESLEWKGRTVNTVVQDQRKPNIQKIFASLQQKVSPALRLISSPIACSDCEVATASIRHRHLAVCLIMWAFSVKLVLCVGPRVCDHLGSMHYELGNRLYFGTAHFC